MPTVVVIKVIGQFCRSHPATWYEVFQTLFSVLAETLMRTVVDLILQYVVLLGFVVAYLRIAVICDVLTF